MWVPNLSDFVIKKKAVHGRGVEIQNLCDNGASYLCLDICEHFYDSESEESRTEVSGTKCPIMMKGQLSEQLQQKASQSWTHLTIIKLSFIVQLQI